METRRTVEATEAKCQTLETQLTELKQRLDEERDAKREGRDGLFL